MLPVLHLWQHVSGVDISNNLKLLKVQFMRVLSRKERRRRRGLNRLRVTLDECNDNRCFKRQTVFGSLPTAVSRIGILPFLFIVSLPSEEKYALLVVKHKAALILKDNSSVFNVDCRLQDDFG